MRCHKLWRDLWKETTAEKMRSRKRRKKEKAELFLFLFLFFLWNRQIVFLLNFDKYVKQRRFVNQRRISMIIIIPFIFHLSLFVGRCGCIVPLSFLILVIERENRMVRKQKNCAFKTFLIVFLEDSFFWIDSCFGDNFINLFCFKSNFYILNLGYIIIENKRN